MANEKKTERIVYSHFEKSSDIIHIEEQSSDIAKIDKLLKTASKKGMGQGRPEFLITYNKNTDLLIVIECKAETTKHESPDKDKYADYAVDGVLLYASYLSKEFDVLAIAVSGETTQQLKVSHFLHLKTERKPTPIFGDKLLSAQEYLDGYLKSPEKFRQDYNTLLEFTKQLNDQLHTYKIPENQRALLISAILIALEDDVFKTSYPKKITPKNLADFLTKTVSEKLEESNIAGQKLDNLNSQFGFIKTDTSLSTKDKVLKQLIDEIDENVNSFIKTHEYFDVLGQLYIEFLRYANSDKGLGIVLTPPHITEFFAELAGVNKNSIAFDNCTGTGGFLISAMKAMIDDANGDTAKIAEIKSKQLIGVEYQAHIFALAVSNMYIHQDGKTNIINGSCFDEAVINEVKARKPTVGFLNPPFKADRKNDTEELEFIFNNLDCLVDGGTCVAIVPMERALATKGKVYEWKKKLLDQHTLEAVLSMPNELFDDSEANAVTCVMIFTAHKAHPKGKKTYFGYYKDDGFVVKKKGRIDLFDRWETIQDKWKNNYINRENEAGLSITKEVKAEDEWSTEIYMETGIQSLNDRQFTKTLLNYVTFLLFNELSDSISKKTFSDDVIKLNTDTWSFYQLIDLFEITGSRTTPLMDLQEIGIGSYPYVSTQTSNNGIRGFFDHYTEVGNVLTVDSAVLGFCSYQASNFSASDHVEKLIPNFKLNKYTALFLVTVINLEQYRYNYGRKCSQARMRQAKIKLPTKNDQPDFEFMENYIKSLPYSSSI
jgi:type I restriction enzyme M protein